MTSLPKKWITLISLGILLILVACQGESDDQGSNEENSDAAHITEIDGNGQGTGTMDNAQESVDSDNMDLELTPSSEPAMVKKMKNAIEKEEPIVVTLWQPHWMFSEHDLKFLEDPKETLGASENIHTMVRHGLEDDQPSAYALLDNFNWEVDDMNEVMAIFGQGDDEI